MIIDLLAAGGASFDVEAATRAYLDTLQGPARAQSDAYFDLVQAFFAHWFGRLILFGFTWALIHHALGGLRHFVWDMGKGFKLSSVEWMVRANLVGSIVLTILLWAVAYGVKS